MEKLTFDERCDLVRKTSINLSMPYEERLRLLKIRYGVF